MLKQPEKWVFDRAGLAADFVLSLAFCLRTKLLFRGCKTFAAPLSISSFFGVFPYICIRPLA